MPIKNYKSFIDIQMKSEMDSEGNRVIPRPKSAATPSQRHVSGDYVREIVGEWEGRIGKAIRELGKDLELVTQLLIVSLKVAPIDEVKAWCAKD